MFVSGDKEGHREVKAFGLTFMLSGPAVEQDGALKTNMYYIISIITVCLEKKGLNRCLQDGSDELPVC